MTSIHFSNYSELIPIECFLNRIFPPGFYKDDIEDIVHNRLFKPRKDCKPYKLDVPIDWESVSNSEDRNWRMQLQGWAMFHPIMNFFDSSDLKDEIIKYFFDVISDWYQNYKSDDEKYVTSRMPDSYVWYDMSVGFRALVLAFFSNRIAYYKIDLTNQQQELLFSVVTKHISNLSYEPAFSLNNHGLFQIQGLMALLNLFDIPESDKLKSYSMDKMYDLITSQFSQEGIHKEHSPHYHFYALDTAISIVKTGWYDKSIEEYINKAVDARKWLIDPLRRPICVGDSILTEQTSVNFPEQTSEEKYIYADFSTSGYNIIRSNWAQSPNTSSMLFMTGMYHTKAHKHRDCLSFDLFENGTRIICDSGKYGYRSDKYRNYFLSSRAHNSVEIEGFDIIKMKPYGSNLLPVKELKENCFELSGSLDYPAIKHNRFLTYKPAEFLLVHDDLKFTRERSFTQWFHLEKSFHVVRVDGNSVHLTDNNGNRVRIENFNKDIKLVLHYGDDDAMQGFISDRDYKYEPGVAIGFNGNAKAIQLCTLITTNNEVTKSMIDLIDSKGLKADTSNYKKKFQYESYAKTILKNIKHVFLDKKKPFLKGKATYTKLINDIPFKFYIDNKNSENLTIFLPGATNRDKGACDFQRHSWSDEFSETVVSIADPTINDDNDLSIGWFQYLKDNSGLDGLEILVKFLIKELNISLDEVRIIGSSAGGFAAMKMAERFSDISVLAINPQLYLHRYSPNYYKAMLDYSYEGIDEKDVLKKFKERTFALCPKSNTCIILQNIHDTKHLNKHLKPYISTLPNVIEMNSGELASKDIKKDYVTVIYYEDEKLKHSPPSRIETINYINKIWGSLWQ